MTTTGELRTILEELQMIDVGEAASYLGEELFLDDETLVTGQPVLLPSTIHSSLGTSIFPMSDNSN